MEKIGLVCLWFLFAVMIVILVITFIWGIRHAYISTKKAIEEDRLKKFIKDNEQKAVPCHCGCHAKIEHRFGEFYHIGCPCCPIGFTDKDIPKLVKMWNDVQSIKVGDCVGMGLLRGRVQSISYGEAYIYTNTYNAPVEVPLVYLKKIKSSAKVV